ncbi:MAG: hypothetical protein ABSB29_05610 [Nitrososphaerales archaeon]|jgi:hypothetical protein
MNDDKGGFARDRDCQASEEEAGKLVLFGRSLPSPSTSTCGRLKQ